MLKTLFFVLVGLYSWSAYAWNAVGHQLVAQIAYDNLTPKAIEWCSQYHHDKARPYGAGFVKSASWLDDIRRRDIHRYDALHYIDIPFSTDATTPPRTPNINALTAIQHALLVLNSKKSSFSEKKLNLRILTHVVGDIHQPLHTVTRVSQQHPQGDLGGNLFYLAKNAVGKNLHQYWDRGAGALVFKPKYLLIKRKAKKLESKWPCTPQLDQMPPEQWVGFAHDLALSQAYFIHPGSKPGKQYQRRAQNTSERQITLAGCRLARLINALS